MAQQPDFQAANLMAFVLEISCIVENLFYEKCFINAFSSILTHIAAFEESKKNNGWA